MNFSSGYLNFNKFFCLSQIKWSRYNGWITVLNKGKGRKIFRKNNEGQILSLLKCIIKYILIWENGKLFNNSKKSKTGGSKSPKINKTSPVYLQLEIIIIIIAGQRSTGQNWFVILWALYVSQKMDCNRMQWEIFLFIWRRERRYVRNVRCPLCFVRWRKLNYYGIRCAALNWMEIPVPSRFNKKTTRSDFQLGNKWVQYSIVSWDFLVPPYRYL